ncbi:ATP-binding/permease protein CydD [Serratia symbiotica]|nr:ATP-binding/permease protein CydD [Serratia symbiotica]
MNQTKKKQLIYWLNTQGIFSKCWLWVSIILGAINSILIIIQSLILAHLLHDIIIIHILRKQLILFFVWLFITFLIRSLLFLLREYVIYVYGKNIRQNIRKKILDKLQFLGPEGIKNKSIGNWVSIIIEQIENIQDYYSRYLPQVYLVKIIPCIILIIIFYINWVIGIILFCTIPLIFIFMILIGKNIADISRRNFLLLERLSGTFFDLLRGLDTLRLYNRTHAESTYISNSSENFRYLVTKILRLAFLSSAVLEFFSLISIAMISSYLFLLYIGVFNFGHYGFKITFFYIMFILILVPEFFQPLLVFGTFYHAKSQALGAAEVLENFLNYNYKTKIIRKKITLSISPELHASNLEIISSRGIILSSPLNFILYPGQRVAIVGCSGSGKSLLINLLLGFLSYRGSLMINGIELRDLYHKDWHKYISWIGQNSYLPEKTIISNILLGSPKVTIMQLLKIIKSSYVSEFLSLLPHGLQTEIGDNALRLSIGQIQRIIIARALINPCKLLLLDEPTSGLDMYTENYVMKALNHASYLQSTLFVTHKLIYTKDYDQIWVMHNGNIIQKGNYNTLSIQSGFFSKINKYYYNEI